jgi:TRAP-type mannitol/chloroaromatic compound transport system permease large subunit
MVRESCMDTIAITGMVIWLMIAANLFRVFFTSVGAQELILDLVLGLPVSSWVVFAGMQVILLILGCFMDDFAIITICAPIFYPIAISLGFDPMWYAIVFIINMEIGYLTPPFGWALIMVKGLAPPEITTRDIWHSSPPFIAIMFLVLIIVILFPQLTLWLPGMMRG